VSRIFLSHSSRDNREALALKQWLTEQRPQLANEIFLDIDPDFGLQLGAKWKGALFDSNSRCEALICLVSRSWEASHECKTEYRTAEGLGKQILCARIEDTGDSDITSEWQRCDLFVDGAQTEIPLPCGQPVRFNTAALYQIRKAIEGTGIGPRTFVWPPIQDPTRAPYRGWEPFEDIDAGVFFGRDAAIARGLDELRGMRFRLLAQLSGQKSLFVVLGPSGSGKSSFLRAGLIPRLQRDDRRFVMLGIVRPERNALTGDHGLAAAIDAARQSLHLSGAPFGEIKNACLQDPDRVVELLAEIRAAAAERLSDVVQFDAPASDRDGAPGHPSREPSPVAVQEDSAPTLVLPLDQAEELFSADAGAQAEQFLALLAQLAGRMNATETGLIVAATIRTDRYDEMQNNPALTSVGKVLFDELKPMPATQFEQVITGPAGRASEGGQQLIIAADLVTQLLTDAAEGADALPLLALTLARLQTDYASTGQLTLAQYEAMGGMRHVVQTAIDEVLDSDPEKRSHQLELLRAAFIPWLATINPDSDEPLRRVTRESDLPEASRPLIDVLVEKRLLVRDERDGHVLVEVALESLLRQWDDLAGWLREERQNLKAADDIERNARAWDTHDHDAAWLLTGTRLTDAETLAKTPGFRSRLASTHDYLAAGRQAENEKLAADEQQREAELRHAQERQQAAEALAAAETEARARAQEHAVILHRRSRILAIVAVISVVAASAAVLGFVVATQATQRADARTREAVATKLTTEAKAMIAGDEGGGEARAIQQILAAPRIASSADTGVQFTEVVARRDTLKIIQTPDVVRSVAVSPDGHRLVSGSYDHTLRLWNADTGQPIESPLTGHTDVVRSVAFSADGHRIVSGSNDRTLRVWDADTGQQIGAPLTGHQKHVTSVAFSPDGHRIVSGSDDLTLRVWDADTGRQIGAPLTGHTNWVVSVAFSPDGHRIVSGSWDKTLRLWDAGTGHQIGTLTGHTASVNSVAFSPDGHRIVSGSTDHTLRLWDADTGQGIGTLTEHQGSVRTVAFSPDGHRIVSGGSDNTLRLWDVGTGHQIGVALTGHQGTVYSVAFSPDGHRIFSSSGDLTLRSWNADSSAPLTGHTDVVDSVAFSPDGHRIVSGGYDNTLLLWDADTGHQIGVALTGHTASVNSVAFSPDGHRIVSGSNDNTLCLWDADTGQPIGLPLTGHTDAVRSVAFSPDGRRIVSGSNDLTLRLWDAGTGQPIGLPLTGHEEHVTSVAFSPDGRRIVSGSDDRTLRLWDAGTGHQIGAPLIGHTNWVNSVAFSPDGRRIVSGSTDNTVRIWDAGAGREIGAPLTGHTEWVNSVAFSPDGHRIVSGSDDRTLRLWDAETGVGIGAPMTGHAAAVRSVAFSPDGERIVSGSDDDTLRLWPAPAAAAWPGLLCDKITANMSHPQWNKWVSPDISYVAVCPGLPIPS
jgi:WD40 repeat protein